MKIFYILSVSLLSFLGVDAQSWSPVLTGMNNTVFSFAVYNGELYAGGYFTLAGGNTASLVAKWNGTSWTAVGTGMGTNGGYVTALAVYNGELYAGGGFDTAGGNPASSIAKWNGSSWSAVGTYGMNNPVWALAVYNGELYAGGPFSTVDGNSANKIAKWNGTVWSTVSTGMGGPFGTCIKTLSVYNGELHAGGYFGIAGGVLTSNIAKWDGTNWSAVGAGITDTVGTVTPTTVLALTVHNNELYAGGFFTLAGSVPTTNIAKWDGTNWSAVGGAGMDKTVRTLHVYNYSLYA